MLVYQRVEQTFKKGSLLYKRIKIPWDVHKRLEEQLLFLNDL